MITYEDIKKILESVDIAKLEKDYMTRQEVNLLDNTKKAKDVLAYFPDELIYLPKGLDNIGKLNALLMLYLNSGHSSAKRLIIEILKKYGYNPNNELLRAIQISDLYFEGQISQEDYIRAIGGLTNSKGVVNIKMDEIHIRTMQGMLKLQSLCKTLGIRKITDEERRGFCHNLTSDVLIANKKLYGGYYYIPLSFTGYIEHSVVIDLEKSEVLDFANNIIVPLKIWKKFFGSPTIFINGDYYQELAKQSKEKLNVDLNICLLEQVRRRCK